LRPAEHITSALPVIAVACITLTLHGEFISRFATGGAYHISLKKSCDRRSFCHLASDFFSDLAQFSCMIAGDPFKSRVTRRQRYHRSQPVLAVSHHLALALSDLAA